MMNEFGGHYWGMGWWWIIVLFIIVAIVWMALKAVEKTRNRNTSFAKTPLDILKERYARGEIDKQEFEEKKNILGS